MALHHFSPAGTQLPQVSSNEAPLLSYHSTVVMHVRRIDFYIPPSADDLHLDLFCRRCQSAPSVAGVLTHSDLQACGGRFRGCNQPISVCCVQQKRRRQEDPSSSLWDFCFSCIYFSIFATLHGEKFRNDERSHCNHFF